MSKSKIVSIIKHPLVHNSYTLLLNTIVLTVGGFIFWMLASRFFKPDQVGLATTFNSFANIISGIGVLGLSSALLRFIGLGEKVKMINTSLSLSFLTTLILSLIVGFIVYKKVDAITILLVFYALSISGSEVLENSLIGLKNYYSVLVKNIIFSIAKIIILIFLITFNEYGLMFSMFLSTLASVFVAIYYLVKQYNISFRFEISRDVLSKLGSYSTNSLLTGQVGNATGYLLPIIITYLLSPASTAYYSIVASVAAFLFVIPKVISQTFLIENSETQVTLKEHFRKSVLLTYALYIPAAITFYFFGNFVLGIFGSIYVNSGIELLRIMVFAGLFISINYILGTVLLIKKFSGLNMIISVTTNILTLLLSIYWLKYGINGVGYATVVAQFSASLFYGLLFLRKLKI